MQQAVVQAAETPHGEEEEEEEELDKLEELGVHCFFCSGQSL